MFNAFSKKGDTEKFYFKYYTAIPFNSTEYFKEMLPHYCQLR